MLVLRPDPFVSVAVSRVIFLTSSRLTVPYSVFGPAVVPEHEASIPVQILPAFFVRGNANVFNPSSTLFIISFPQNDPNLREREARYAAWLVRAVFILLPTRVE